MLLGWFLTKFAFFVSIRNLKWAPLLSRCSFQVYHVCSKTGGRGSSCWLAVVIFHAPPAVALYSSLCWLETIAGKIWRGPNYKHDRNQTTYTINDYGIINQINYNQRYRLRWSSISSLFSFQISSFIFSLCFLFKILF